MSRTYFGTDGIRGTVGQAPITPDFVLRLAHAVVYWTAIPYLRTILFTLAFIAEVGIFWEIIK